MKTVLLTALAVMALAVAAACGGGDRDDVRGDRTPLQLVSANPAEVLGASAQMLDEDVGSLRAEFRFDVDMDGVALGATGEMLIKEPDQMYMRMEMTGGEDMFDLGMFGSFEVLVHGDRVYMSMPFLGGWFVMDVDDPDADLDGLQELLEGGSPFDFALMVERIGGEVQDMGTETIDGKTHQHYRFTLDFADMLEALGDFLDEAFGDDAGSDEFTLDDFFGPTTIDVWIDPDTVLPRRLTGSGSFNVDDAALGFTMQIDFLEYNGEVAIPDPPADAMPIEDLFGDLFGLDNLDWFDDFEFDGLDDFDFESFEQDFEEMFAELEEAFADLELEFEQ